MSDEFTHDVFLSHSAKDRKVVRELAERLKAGGLRVWFDAWEIKPGDSIPAKIEEGLERSRVLVLCMSANAFGSDWAQLESGTFRFRDPLNKERRFLPLRLDDAPIKGSLAQFLYIDWRTEEREQEYTKLIEACRPLAREQATVASNRAGEGVPRSVFQLKLQKGGQQFTSYEFSTDGKTVVTRSFESELRMWDIGNGSCIRVYQGHTDEVGRIAWSPDGRRLLSGGKDKTARIWDVESGECLRVLNGHVGTIADVSWSRDQLHVMTTGNDDDQSIRLWDVETGRCLRILKGHIGWVASPVLSRDQHNTITCGKDGTIRLWDLATGSCIRVFSGHTQPVDQVVWSADERLAISCCRDNTIRLWDVIRGHCLRVLEGHTGGVHSIALRADERFLISCSWDKTVRVWDIAQGNCVLVLKDHTEVVQDVAWSTDGRGAFSGDNKGGIRVWDLSEFVPDLRAPKVTVPILPLVSDQVQYTNAKVLLVGESGAGKTGLSKRLALDEWQPSDSTVGAWATQWKLPVTGGEGVEREIWLWDFGGQADQRLIHQLYMDETALAVLVFDSQKEDLFETLGQWDRDLTRASRREFAKLLVAGRVDAGGLRASRSEVEKFAAERKFGGFLETSAKRNTGCEELKQAILDAIQWDELPCRTTEVLFKRLKEEIIALKDEGRVLLRFNELRETLQLRLAQGAERDVARHSNVESGEGDDTRTRHWSVELRKSRFTEAELRAVLTLLAGPGVVWELAFGSWVLLQPERINAYAQAVIGTLRADKQQRGCLMEERVLKGDLIYESSMERLQGDEERFVLLAMHQTLVERGLCLRQPTSHGNLLVFPSYYRRERPDIVKHPAVLVNYRFTGFLDEIYATLVVRLHHSEAFDQDHLWRYAADFKTKTGKQLGLKMERRGPGLGNLEVFFDTGVSVEEKILFSKYIHEHLLQHARGVERLRHYVCPDCGTPVGNREVAMKRLNEWLLGRPPETAGFKLFKGKDKPPTIICVGCEKRVPLWDEMEQCFASPEIQQRVRDMQEEANIELDNESKERALVGEVISTVAHAGQLSREFNVSDHGIDLEIEFKTDPPAADKPGEATGEKLYLQLKSGDSYTRKRKGDGAEIFAIKDERHARYWMMQKFPVLLVVRNSEGEVRWMEVRDLLKRASDNGKKPVKQIVFEGERFDVMSVRRWREKILGATVTP